MSGGEKFGGSKLQVPESARKDEKKIFESYMLGPMAVPVVLTETAGTDVRLTVVGGMTIRQTMASNILSGMAKRDGERNNVAAAVDFALRLTDALMLRTKDDVRKFKEAEIEPEVHT